MDKSQIEDFYPLTPLQAGLLFHSLYAQQSGEYVVQLSYLLEGELKVDAFKRAWQQVVNAHPILRSSFLVGSLKEPVQVVKCQVLAPIVEQDWRGLNVEEQEEQMKADLSKERSRGFELTQAPLMRMSLVRLGEASYSFSWSYHHLLLDGWSVPLLVS